MRFSLPLNVLTISFLAGIVFPIGSANIPCNSRMFLDGEELGSPSCSYTPLTLPCWHGSPGYPQSRVPHEETSACPHAHPHPPPRLCPILLALAQWHVTAQLSCTQHTVSVCCAAHPRPLALGSAVAPPPALGLLLSSSCCPGLTGL